MVFHEAVHRALHSGSSFRWSVSPAKQQGFFNPWFLDPNHQTIHSIYTHMDYRNKPNVGKYTLHGWYGQDKMTLLETSMEPFPFPTFNLFSRRRITGNQLLWVNPGSVFCWWALEPWDVFFTKQKSYKKNGLFFGELCFFGKKMSVVLRKVSIIQLTQKHHNPWILTSNFRNCSNPSFFVGRWMLMRNDSGKCEKRFTLKKLNDERQVDSRHLETHPVFCETLAKGNWSTIWPQKNQETMLASTRFRTANSTALDVHLAFQGCVITSFFSSFAWWCLSPFF